MLHSLLTRLLTALVALTLVLATGATALAQEATPAASPVAGGAGPQVGDAVVLFTNSGKEQAQIAVTQIVDPFEEVESEAQRGFHYVMAEVVVENLSDAPYDFNPYVVSLLDAEGFIYTVTYATRSSEAMEELPDFQPGTIEPGETASGALFFEVIDDASVDLVVVSDGYQQFAIVVDQRSEIPSDGEEVPIYDSNADEIGTISVDQIVTGLEETDQNITVERGQTVIAVVITVTNAGDAPLVSPAGGMRVVDEFGVVSYSSYAYRGDESLAQLPDFPTDDIAPGDSATGAVIFTLPSDAIVTYVLYQADYTRLTIAGQPGEGSVVSGDELEPVAVPTQDPADEEPVDEEPTEEPADATPVALTGDCADLQEWVEATEENLASLDDLEGLDAETPDPDALRDDAGVLRDAAESQADIDTPEIAADGQEAIVAFIEAYADLLEESADQLEAGEEVTDIFASFGEGPFADAFADFTTAATDLQTACPDVDFGDLV